MDKDYEVGQQTILNSGGPRMTVSAVEEHLIKCSWFNEAGELCHGKFFREMIRPALDVDVKMMRSSGRGW